MFEDMKRSKRPTRSPPKPTRRRRLWWIASIPLVLLIGFIAWRVVFQRSTPAIGSGGAVAAEIVQVLEPLPRPTEPVTFEDGCVTPQCHASYLADSGVHEPVAQLRCARCHEADAGDHTYVLLMEADALCQDCHATGQMGAWRHVVLDNEGCLACHDAHAAEAPFLLTSATVEETCAQCHPPREGVSSHEPYARGECAACHEAHEADNPGLLRGGEGVEHCRSCHQETVAAMDAALYSHDVVEGSCLRCHGPHATDHEHLLADALVEQCLSCHDEVRVAASQTIGHDAVLSGERCLSCHTAHASDDPLMLRADKVTVCLSCHNEPITATDGRTIPDMTAAVTERAFEHGPVEAGDCTACHSVHGSEHARLLREPAPAALVGEADIRNYALCFSCHDQALMLAERTTVATQFRNGDLNLHALHISGENRGRSCTSCHTVHGSDQPRHMAEAVAYQGSDWLMPMAFALTDDGGSCAPGCHEPLSYSRGEQRDAESEATGGAP